jgi:hypothetical protein
VQGAVGVVKQRTARMKAELKDYLVGTRQRADVLDGQ